MKFLFRCEENDFKHLHVFDQTVDQTFIPLLLVLLEPTFDEFGFGPKEQYFQTIQQLFFFISAF